MLVIDFEDYSEIWRKIFQFCKEPCWKQNCRQKKSCGHVILVQLLLWKKQFSLCGLFSVLCVQNLILVVPICSQLSHWVQKVHRTLVYILGKREQSGNVSLQCPVHTVLSTLIKCTIFFQFTGDKSLILYSYCECILEGLFAQLIQHLTHRALLRVKLDNYSQTALEDTKQSSRKR